MVQLVSTELTDTSANVHQALQESSARSVSLGDESGIDFMFQIILHGT